MEQHVSVKLQGKNEDEEIGRVSESTSVGVEDTLGE